MRRRPRSLRHVVQGRPRLRNFVPHPAQTYLDPVRLLVALFALGGCSGFDSYITIQRGDAAAVSVPGVAAGVDPIEIDSSFSSYDAARRHRFPVAFTLADGSVVDSFVTPRCGPSRDYDSGTATYQFVLHLHSLGADIGPGMQASGVCAKDGQILCSWQTDAIDSEC